MHKRETRREGFHQLLSPEKDGARELSVSRLILAQGDRVPFAIKGQETIAILIEGHIRAHCQGHSWEAKRKSPFEERASGVYLPPDTQAAFSADLKSEVILISTPCAGRGESAFIGPDRVNVNARGEGNYGREVHDIFVNDPYAKRLLVGETFNPEGHWSSYPPHKHDGGNGEPYLEEAYYYRLNPAQGIGYQALYSRDSTLDEAYTVKDGDLVLISRGFHPVGAAPGYQLYYLWALAGEQRKLALYEDPDHTWIKDAVQDN